MSPENGLGPPKEGGPVTDRATTTATTRTDVTECNAAVRQCTATQLRRRRAASYRCPPLDCSCRDPWPCKHYRDPYISDKQAEAAVAAIEHLDLVGTPGLLDERTCRAMWRVGRRDLAVAVQRRTAGAA
jgi:hypothetical protein